MTPWTAAVARAAAAVSSMGRLAVLAGLPRQELHRIASGERRATLRVGRAVLRALEHLAAEQRRGAAVCDRHAKALRRALGRGPR